MLKSNRKRERKKKCWGRKLCRNGKDFDQMINQANEAIIQIKRNPRRVNSKLNI